MPNYVIYQISLADAERNVHSPVITCRKILLTCHSFITEGKSSDDYDIALSPCFPTIHGSAP